MKERLIPQLCAEESACCGCTACMSVCPTGAIAMVDDEKGFPYPRIDGEKCLFGAENACGSVALRQIEKKNLVNEETLRAYAVRAKSAEVVGQSSSGGAFTVLSDYILGANGAIASAVYDYSTHQQVFRLYTDPETRNQARGSKYIHPILGDIYAKCIAWMKENPGRPLMFVGLGCQVDGFSQVLKASGMEGEAVLVDIICHGAPSPQLWKDYILWLQERYGGTADYITFKDKRNGWENPLAFARIDGEEIPLSEYSWWFYEDYAQRSSCFNCPYTRLKRNSDITIGDFWGVQRALPDFYDPRGNSLILIQSSKGAELFENVKDSLDWAKTETELCIQPRLESPGQANPRREQFWKDYRKGGVTVLSRRYHEDGKMLILAKRCVNKAKRLIKKLF